MQQFSKYYLSLVFVLVGSNIAFADTFNAMADASMGHLDLLRVGMQNMRTSGYTAGDDPDDREVWLKAFSSSSRQKSRDSYQGYNARVYGTTIGADRSALEGRGRVGLGFSYSDTRTKLKNSNGSRFDINSYHGMIYGSCLQNNWFWSALFTGGYNKNKSRRGLILAGANRVARADYSGYQLGGRLRLGYRVTPFSSRCIEIVPSVTAEATRAKYKKYSERDAGTANLLDEKINSVNQFAAGPGIILSCVPDPNSSAKVYPSAHIHYLQNFTKERDAITLALEGNGGAFRTDNLRPANYMYNPGLAVNVALNQSWFFILEYDAYLKKKYVNHSGSLSFRYVL